jgi:mannose/fructose/N-acetylgalactosamine-specific phosphotransferase system component IIC
MIEVGPVMLGWLMVWGTLLGLDLVSLPQMMISRPLVAGAVAGWIVGDPAFGISTGLVLELFALESLAIGAARYPDYGAATVGAVVAGAGHPTIQALGIAVTIGLVLAGLGGLTLMWLRHANSRSVRRRAASLQVGDPVAVYALQFGGLGRDLTRSLILAVLAILVGWEAHIWVPRLDPAASMLSFVVIGGGLAGAVSGAIKTAGRGGRLRWLAVGGLVGSLAVVVLWA